MSIAYATSTGPPLGAVRVTVSWRVQWYGAMVGVVRASECEGLRRTLRVHAYEGRGAYRKGDGPIRRARGWRALSSTDQGDDGKRDVAESGSQA